MRETSIHDEYPDAHVADWIGQSKANLHAYMRLTGIADPEAYQQALRDAVDDALQAADCPRMTH